MRVGRATRSRLSHAGAQPAKAFTFAPPQCRSCSHFIYPPPTCEGTNHPNGRNHRVSLKSKGYKGRYAKQIAGFASTSVGGRRRGAPTGDGGPRSTLAWQPDLVQVTVEKCVALITVNDPDRRNAVTAEMSARLRDTVERTESDPEVHALVVTGAGKAFCAGADLSALGAGGGSAETGLRHLYDGFMAIGGCRLPTIAAVNGAAVGAGLNLALAADVRIAGPGALFDARFQKFGLHPGGATWMLQRAVGPQVARAALLFGMRLDAESAVQHGLALRVADDPVAAALRVGRRTGGGATRRGRGDQSHDARHVSPGSLENEQPVGRGATQVAFGVVRDPAAPARVTRSNP